MTPNLRRDCATSILEYASGRSLIEQSKYKVHDLMATNSHRVMVAITKCMYDLPQAGILAPERLLNRLSKHGYRPVPNTPSLSPAA